QCSFDSQVKSPSPFFSHASFLRQFGASRSAASAQAVVHPFRAKAIVALDASIRSNILLAIEGYRSAMLEWTHRLVAIPTENPPRSHYTKAVAHIVHHLNGLGLSDTQVVGDCVLSFVGESERTLYFSGHYDVVPAQDRSQFEPYIKGANLFGRGSSDMKSGLAAMAYAAKAIRD